MDNALGDAGSLYRTYMEVGSKLGHHGRTIPYIRQFITQSTHSSHRTHMEVGSKLGCHGRKMDNALQTPVHLAEQTWKLVESLAPWRPWKDVNTETEGYDVL